VRTNAEGQSAEALAEDVAYLQRAWQLIREASAGTRVGQPVYDDLSLPLRAMRDLMSREVDKVRVDSRETFERILTFARQFMPDLADRVEHYAGERPVFDLYGVEDESSGRCSRKFRSSPAGTLSSTRPRP
jgi:ribonuclease G